MSVKLEDRDRGWRELLAVAREAKKRQVKVGVLEGKGDEVPAGSELTVAEIAAVLHHGTEHLKARPFLTQTFDKHRADYVALAGKLLDQAFAHPHEMPITRALGLLGQHVVADIKAAIVNREFAPNQPSTIARKGSDTPLVDTARMLNAITYALDDG